MHWALTICRRLIAVSIGFGQVADLLNRGVNRVLEFLVEACGLVLDFGQVGNLALEGDAELVAAVLGQANLLRVVGFESDHGGSFR